MRLLTKLELDKLIRRKYLLLGGLLLLGYSSFMFFSCCMNSSPTFPVETADGVEVTGRAAALYNKSVYEQYAGELTDEAVAHVLDDFVDLRDAHGEHSFNWPVIYDNFSIFRAADQADRNQKIQMMNGEKTSLAFVKGDPMGKLVKLLRMLTGDKYGYDYSDIVILTLKTESESIMNNISKISGIPITREKSNSSILFTTAKKFKGLESRVIIIVDIDESSFNDEKEKRNFYVACSRATQYLSLIVEGDDQKIKSIADVIAGPNFAPKGKIAMKTQATPLRLD